jgi:ubiquinone/menaquinone biosynthesis C-methylase UbiE
MVHSCDAPAAARTYAGCQAYDEERPMTEPAFDDAYGANPAENYERFFVPLIGAPLAEDLIEAAALRPGERVLDVACGTGVVTRLAAARVGPDGTVAGADIHPAMLAVARAASDDSIAWYETSAEAMPLPDESYDVVLCQMGLQFVSNKLAALREMRRVLAPGGRALLNVPGPTPPMFSILADALARHVDPQTGSFMHAVFSLHDAGELRDLMERAGFRDTAVDAETKTLQFPPPEQFLWQYVLSTPLAERLAPLDEERRAALETDVRREWQPFVSDGGMTLELRMTTVSATR